jgi:uncharacterized protein YjbI with pentapeptide repeats
MTDIPAGNASEVARKANDLGEITKALDDAGGVVLALWITFISFEIYLAIAAGGVSHRQLLLEQPIVLPLVNASVPLVVFAWLAPILFVIFHFYLLLQLVLLALTAGRYNEVLEKTVADPVVRRNLRLQLPKNIYVQILTAPRDLRHGAMGLMLRVVASTTVVLGPLLLLLLFQLQFLPYHHQGVTWIQRICVLADLALLWGLWSAVVAGDGEVRWPRFLRAAWAVLGSAAAIVFSVMVATFPGEIAYTWSPFVRWTPIYDLVFNGSVNELTGARNSLFSSTLVLPNLKLVKDEDVEKLETSEETAGPRSDGVEPRSLLDVRGRNLIGAVFANTDLRRTNFAGAQLQGADFTGANLAGSVFSCGNIGKTGLRAGCTDLTRARFVSADIHRANFLRADLKLASFAFASAQGAVFEQAELQGVDFGSALLQGASFSKADLTGAYLESAKLQAAMLNSAILHGVWARQADFRLAVLDNAHLEGADATESNFEGASLYQATLHGANFSQTKIYGADFTQVIAWRTELNDLKDVKKAKIDGLRRDDIWLQPPTRCYRHITDQDVDTIYSAVSKVMAETQYGRQLPMKAIFDRLKHTGESDGVDRPENGGDQISSIGQDDFNTNLAKTATALICTNDDGLDQVSRSVAESLAEDPGNLDRSPMLSPVTAGLLLNGDSCPAGSRLPPYTKRRLRTISQTQESNPQAVASFDKPKFPLLSQPCPGIKPIEEVPALAQPAQARSGMPSPSTPP